MPKIPEIADVAAALQLSIGLCIRRIRQPLAEGELSLPEASVLKRLEFGGPTTVTELAKADQITVQSMGTTLSALESRGLVERHPHPSDGRRSVLSITKTGLQTLENKHNSRSQQVANALSEGFSPSELQQLMVAAPLIERLAQSL